MVTSRFAPLAWGPLLVAAAFVSPLKAQSASLRGFVRDTSGAPVAFAHVTVGDARGVADTAGQFAFLVLPPGPTSLLVRRLGYAPRSVPLILGEGRSDSVYVILKMLPRELAGITTEVSSIVQLAEFNRHRVHGQGIYLDRQQIEERRTSRLSDIMRRLPGVRIVTDRVGRVHLRMGRTSGGRDCPPDFWIDGVRAQYLGVDDVPVSDIEALEIYRGPSGLPPEFNSRMGSPACGAVIIWTRVPG